MEREQYLLALAEALQTQKIDNVPELIAAYESHFAIKHEDGYSDAEIIAHLRDPNEVAAQCNAMQSGETAKKIGIGAALLLSLLDILMALVLVVLVAWFLTMAIAIVCCLIAGFSLVIHSQIGGLIPYMPYIAALLTGLACLALSMVLVAGTLYYYAYAMHLGKAYIDWHQKQLFGSAYPPATFRPPMQPKRRRLLRRFFLLSLLAFIFLSALAGLSIAVSSRFVAPWEAWHWF